MAKIKVKKTKPMKLAYIEHTGPYDQVPWEEYLEQLYAWAKKQKVRPGFRPIGIYHDNPEETKPEACRSQVAITIKGGGSAAEGVNIKELPALQIAELKFKGPSTELGDAYREIMAWMQENGYQGAGPSMEVYRRKPKEKNGKVILSARIQVPIRKA